MGKRKNEAIEADTEGKKAKLSHESHEEHLAAVAGSTLAGIPEAHTEEQSSNEDSSVALPLVQLCEGPDAENGGAGVIHDQDDARSSTNDATQPDSEDSEEPTSTTILDLPREILLEILYPLVLQKYQGTERNPDLHVVFKARNIFRGVCKTWCEYIDSDSILWKDIYVNGSRIPAEDEYFLDSKLQLPHGCTLEVGGWVWKEMYESQREILKQGAYNKAEAPIAELSVDRSGDCDVNLILLDPTYQLPPGSFGPNTCVVPYAAREGVMELIDGSLRERKITSLFIAAHEQGIKHCFSEDIDPSMSRLPPAPSEPSEMEEEERDAMSAMIAGMDEDCYALVNDLQTLRIEEPDKSNWDSDLQRCMLPPGKYPVLRRLEIKTTKQLRLFAFPYAQLTDLKLDTGERDAILLGIIKECAALKHLAVILREAEDPGPGATSVVHHRLTKVHIAITGLTNTGKYFLDRIQVAKLANLQVDSDMDCSGPVKGMLQRSKCKITHLHLNLNTWVMAGSGSVAKPTAQNLREILGLVSNTLEDFTIKTHIMDAAWLKGFKPGRRMKSMTFDSAHLKSVPLRECGDDTSLTVEDVATYQFFMYALKWTVDWMEEAPETERANRSFMFVAGPIQNSPHARGPGDFPEQQDPEKTRSLIDRIQALGGDADFSYIDRSVWMRS
ncbi:hypothetical protein DFP72DRAFT_1058231 [Ephemerocybe angulata]|uniref:F-box domain-containing protein n=1 Tax=Ephemerocybe angulata TaxID=980116 RepID=A0A8H6IJM0_9AGAR|nr:hypothetical protein DFP72DRAFT_1058231 [Tulosesus angulatus]